MDMAMYIFINTTIKMDKGKIAGQVGHAVQKLIEDILTNHAYSKTFESKKIMNDYANWRSNGMAKIVLKATEEELEQIRKQPHCAMVRDAGLTQIPPNTLTVIGLLPRPKSELEQLTKNFKLL